MNDKIVLIKDLCKAYGRKGAETKALQNVNLHISRHQFTAIVGRSGSGKSTLLNIIGGLESPTSGKVLIDGTDLFSMKDGERTVFRRKHIGYVFQFFNLIPEMTVYENICLPSYLDHKLPDAEFNQIVMKKLGIFLKKDKYAGELSGGEQQRVAVARALASKPDILLADEPTGNLDSENSKEIISLLRYFNKQYNQTVIIITHDERIALSCDRIIAIEDGRITRDEVNVG